MDRLFNSRGEHIANLVNGRLYASGENIGRQLSSGDLVDIGGNYLGEIVNSTVSFVVRVVVVPTTAMRAPTETWGTLEIQVTSEV